MEHFPKWLTKPMLSGINHSNLDAYLLSLEGWRRGLELQWFPNPKLLNKFYFERNSLSLQNTFSLSGTRRKIYFHGTTGSDMSSEAYDILSDNEKTDVFLKNNQEISIASTTNNWDNLFTLAFINEKIIGVLEQTTANVIGDGLSSISELIDLKNKKRKQNHILRSYLIKKNDKLIQKLNEKGLNLNSIPKRDETIILKDRPGVYNAGDSYKTSLDFFKLSIQEKIKSIIKLLPKPCYGEFDFTIEENEVLILNIRPRLSISLFAFPCKGSPTHLASKLIDYYFPETKDLDLSKGKKLMYYDYRNLLNLFDLGIAEEIIVPSLTEKDIIKTRFIITGKFERTNYRSWVRRQAGRLGIHGYIRLMKNGKIVVIAASDSRKKLRQFKNICRKGMGRVEIEKIVELDWKRQVKQGFIIKRT